MHSSQRRGISPGGEGGFELNPGRRPVVSIGSSDISRPDSNAMTMQEGDPHDSDNDGYDIRQMNSADDAYDAAKAWALPLARPTIA